MTHAKKIYDPAVDALRILSILAVIMIHTTTRTLGQTGNDLRDFPWSLFLNQISRFAVPMFFMISGFVLELSYSHNANYFEYIKKRCSRIFVPYLFWSAVYYVFIYKQHTMSYSQSLLSGSASYQLYFIPTLLIFYLVFPLIHFSYSLLSKKIIMIALGIIQAFLLYYVYFIRPLPYFYPISIALLNYYVFIVGVYAFHHQNEILAFIKKWKGIIALATGTMALYVFFEGLRRFLSTNDYQTFYSQWRPSILLYTMLLAGILYFIFHKRLKLVRTIKTLSKLSFFVFFIHVIILELVWYPVGDYLFRTTHDQIAHQLWFDPLFFFCVASLSFLLASIIHRVPLLSKLTG